MDVALMADIENNAVFHGIVYIMNGDRQFHGAEIGCKVAACTGNAVNQFLPQLGAQFLQLGERTSAYVIRTGYMFKQAHEIFLYF